MYSQEGRHIESLNTNSTARFHIVYLTTKPLGTDQQSNRPKLHPTENVRYTHGINRYL